MANALRRALVVRRESFVFETVFSDPVGDKLMFLAETASLGYTVVLCYIGIPSAANLHAAIRQLPHVFVFDNSDLHRPYRWAATFERGQCVERAESLPPWLDLP